MGVVNLGLDGGEPADLVKPTRLCNMVAAVGFAIMMTWAVFELHAGHVSTLWLELGLVVGFAICPLLNALGRHRAGRIALILVTNGTIFVGSAMFDKGSAGSLPFVAVIALPLLLARPSEKWLLAAGAAIPVALFAVCETGVANHVLGIERQPTPSWYFAANAASAFTCAFLFPLFLYRSNQRAEAELERLGQEKLDRLLHSSIIGVARAKLGGPILEANEALLKLLGFSREELYAGQLQLERQTPPEYVEATRQAMAALKERGVSPVYEKQYFRKDGTRVPVLVGMATLDAVTGDTIGFVLDITSQKAADEHRELLRRSEEAMRMRDLVDSVVSHELKTPLATMTLQIELALRAAERGERDCDVLKRHLLRCRASTHKLGALVNALLDSARIHHGRLALSLGDLDLAEAARSVVNGLEEGGLCQPGRIRVITQGPVVGKWDALRIDEVLTNLCSNAVKYGADGPVEVHVGAEEGSRCARIEIVDHGVGIDNAMLSKIFEPFQRASDDHVQGLGLGLHIVRSIVEGHGGTIEVKSERGQGSRFIVELPRAPAA